MRPDPIILGFDTAAAHCAAALVQGGRVLAARHEAMDRGQAERLIPLIEAVLRDAGAGWADLGGIGVGTGPGNFTGVRIAVAAARGIALARGLPAAGVSRLEAMAAGRPGRWLVAVPGRPGTVYVQVIADGVAAGPVVEAAPGALPAGLADGCLGALGAAAAGF
ncbi:MAG: tRNA (adenosine(37)-N6)-threonylcarbamoyltransferase complex dimerization subunit type 1 TsaB, partial [Gemmobacter sp.]